MAERILRFTGVITTLYGTEQYDFTEGTATERFDAYELRDLNCDVAALKIGSAIILNEASQEVPDQS